MAKFNVFWKRQKEQRGETPDVYTYDDLPKPLRVQIVQIMMETLGDNEAYHNRYGYRESIESAYKAIVEILRREMGEFELPYRTSHQRSFLTELSDYLLNEPDPEFVLSAIELVCRAIANMASEYDYRGKSNAKELATGAISEINERFREHGIGYEYDQQIIRIDAELIHAETIKPALALLNDPKFSGPEQEFRNAYGHYQKGSNKEALNDSLKAFESTMKAIYDARKWSYNKTDPASKLIKVAFAEGLIPSFWESHFSALRTTLEAGVPTGRNKLSGHGQGSVPVVVPDYLTAYILHMTASSIVFLIKADKALPQ